MTVEVRVENKGGERTITVRDADMPLPRAFGRMPPREAFVRLGPGESRTFHVHAAKSLFITEDPSATLDAAEESA